MGGGEGGKEGERREGRGREEVGIGKVMRRRGREGERGGEGGREGTRCVGEVGGTWVWVPLIWEAYIPTLAPHSRHLRCQRPSVPLQLRHLPFLFTMGYNIRGGGVCGCLGLCRQAWVKSHFRRAAPGGPEGKCVPVLWRLTVSWTTSKALLTASAAATACSTSYKETQ